MHQFYSFKVRLTNLFSYKDLLEAKAHLPNFEFVKETTSSFLPTLANKVKELCSLPKAPMNFFSSGGYPLMEFKTFLNCLLSGIQGEMGEKPLIFC